MAMRTPPIIDDEDHEPSEALKALLDGVPVVDDIKTRLAKQMNAQVARKEGANATST